MWDHITDTITPEVALVAFCEWPFDYHLQTTEAFGTILHKKSFYCVLLTFWWLASVTLVVAFGSVPKLREMVGTYKIMVLCNSINAYSVVGMP